MVESLGRRGLSHLRRSFGSDALRCRGSSVLCSVFEGMDVLFGRWTSFISEGLLGYGVSTVAFRGNEYDISAFSH